MSTQDLIDSLPTGIPPGTVGHRVHSQTYKQIFQDLLDDFNSGGGGSTDDGGLSMAAYVAPGADATIGLQACITAAIAGGYSHVKPEFSLVPYELSGRVSFGEMEYRGFGKNTLGGSFVCTTDDAALWFGDYDAGYEGSWSGDFQIDANNVAIAPVVVGVKVQWSFKRVAILQTASDADWETSAALTCIGTQNAVFEEILARGGNVPIRMDGGADTNVFLRCEFNFGTTAMADFCSITTIPGLFDITGWNTFLTCIWEYNDTAAEQLILHRSGNQNLLDNCVVYDTAGSASLDLAIKAVDYYSKGIGSSTLRVRGTTIGCSPVSTTKKACYADWPAHICVEDGNTFVGWNYALSGYCTISGQQTFFAMNTAAIDETTDFPFSPMEEAYWQKNMTRPGTSSVAQSVKVDGDANVRWFQTANGAMAWGDGTASPVDSIFYNAAGQLRTVSSWFADGVVVANLAASTQVLIGSVFGFAGVSLGLGGDTLIHKAGTGIVCLTKLGVTNSAAATTPGAVTKKVEIFDASGASLGFVAVYSSIT